MDGEYRNKNIETIIKSIRVSPFVQSLFKILEDPRNHHIIAWDPSGAYFTITSLEMFEVEIIKNHFKHKSITSFFRQLNLYDFKRLSDGRKTRGKPGPTICTFRHEYFKRDYPEILNQVRRQAKKKPFKQLPPYNFEFATPGDMHAGIDGLNSQSQQPREIVTYMDLQQRANMAYNQQLYYQHSYNNSSIDPTSELSISLDQTQQYVAGATILQPSYSLAPCHQYFTGYPSPYQQSYQPAYSTIPYQNSHP